MIQTARICWTCEENNFVTKDQQGSSAAIDKQVKLKGQKIEATEVEATTPKQEISNIKNEG